MSFDEQGRLLLRGPSEVPQRLPGTMERDAALGWLSLATNEPARASSCASGRAADYAVDRHVRTWWQAADASFPQWLEVDLCGEFTLRALRLIFAPTHGEGLARGAYRYRFEVSRDGQAFETARGASAASDDRDIQYYELDPVRARHVRLSIDGAYDGQCAGVVDPSVFGNA